MFETPIVALKIAECPESVSDEVECVSAGGVLLFFSISVFLDLYLFFSLLLCGGHSISLFPFFFSLYKCV